MTDWRAKLVAGFERLRVPLAIVCIGGGLVAALVPVWSGWGTHHVQTVDGGVARTEEGGPLTRQGDTKDPAVCLVRGAPDQPFALEHRHHLAPRLSADERATGQLCT